MRSSDDDFVRIIALPAGRPRDPGEFILFTPAHPCITPQSQLHKLTVC